MARIDHVDDELDWQRYVMEEYLAGADNIYTRTADSGVRSDAAQTLDIMDTVFKKSRQPGAKPLTWPVPPPFIWLNRVEDLSGHIIYPLKWISVKITDHEYGAMTVEEFEQLSLRTSK